MRNLITLALCLVSASAVFGCSLETETAAGNSEQAVVGVDSYLYLRCNSTSWQPDDKSRLVATATAGVFETAFDVNDAYMMTVGDDCILTETPVKNGWGNWKKFYRSVVAPLVAPGSAGYVFASDAEPENFRVKFPAPGKYRAFVDTRAKTISFTQAGVMNPGDTAWTASGQILLSAANAVYRIDPYREKLQQLDRATGLAKWTFTGNLPLEATSACLSGDVAVIVDANRQRLVGVKAGTGAVEWTSTLGGKLGPQRYWIKNWQCSADSGQVLVSYMLNSEDQGLVSLDRATGAERWSQTFAGGVETQALTRDVAVYYTYQEDAIRVVGVSPTDKTVLRFAYDAQSGQVPTQDAGGTFYLTKGSSLYRLYAPDAPTSGWSRGFSEVAPGVSASSVGATTANAVYLVAPSDVNYVEKINRTTGARAWSYLDASSTPKILSVPGNGKVLLYTQTSTGSNVTVLNDITGAVEWSKAFADAYSYPTTDKQGRIYLLAGKRLLQLDSSTGSTKWTYGLPSFSGYGQASVSEILDSDANGVYLLYSTFGHITLPMGLAALNPTSGAQKWSKFDARNMYYVGSDAATLYMQEASRGSAVAGYAYVK
jgi:hypothetical protein